MKKEKMFLCLTGFLTLLSMSNIYAQSRLLAKMLENLLNNQFGMEQQEFYGLLRNRVNVSLLIRSK